MAFVATLVGASASASAAVVVFPLDPRGVAIGTSAEGTKSILKTLRAVPRLEVIEPKTVAKQLGVDLTEQARKCEYDVFCLVEVGEIMSADHLLIGHIRQRGEGDDRRYEMKLIVVDVLKASITEVLIWNVTPSEQALIEAAESASRRLFAPPDVRVEWKLEPPETRILLYGDPYAPDRRGPVDFWSGAYEVRFEAEGYKPVEKRVVIPKKRGTVVVDIEMNPDLLYVKKRSGKVNPFDKSSRRIGSGVSAAVAGAAEEEEEYNAFLNPFAWGVVTVGAALSAVGIVVMSGAQSSYNDLSQQERFQKGVTVTAEVAIRAREDDAGTYRTGSAGLLGGFVIIAGGLAWMVIDNILSAESAEESSRMSSLDGVVDPSADRAASAWARDLFGAPAP